MHRNVTVVVIILVLVVIAGYLVWLRSKFQQPSFPTAIEEQVTPMPSSTVSASPSATPSTKEATASMKQKTATSSTSKK